MCSRPKSQELRQLRDILTKALEGMENIADRNSPNGSWPSLDMPISPVENQNQWEPHKDPEIQRLSNLVVAAAYQLINLVREPFASLVDVACGVRSLFHYPVQLHLPVFLRQSLLTAALNTANELNVAEILREYGTQGADVLEIAAKCQADAEKLGRCLRILATHHVFREVQPNVFAHNRISSLLDTDVPHEQLREDQLNKYETYTGHNDVSAYLGHLDQISASDVAKASLYHLEDVRTTGELYPSPIRTPFQKALNTSEDLFSWMHNPEHKYEFSRHNACIRATTRWNASEALLSGFDWNSLPEGGIVVDVGGGTGKPAAELAKAFPRLKFVVQDQEAVVQKALKYWRVNDPKMLTEGRVSFTAHDFFKAQPVVGADVYLARIVFHDWDDKHVIQILKRLREAASSKTRLIVADYIIPFASKTSSSFSSLIYTDSPTIDPPPPLLPNLGKAHANTYYVDIATGRREHFRSTFKYFKKLDGKSSK
ncbi:hypothetical protein AGABI2DRAFT_142674 [Agaricus bisporus var. bisporus H97]|uniref:hypothetical protein n=1 Tax=Agaricus bisporus var. bisporus (strain H97 / ATCC MYA-4626 / FGSC 10389) TaxID=936046 RepID=UPI00029F6744|nr:hypothetical protein AGABI2DRAFT_142674 [Agaricus bisporus var. bisporus H97]EKV48581.1 hypothetical protein AGABI2DRAFT_142674 [Agaricus bisporus var. bisporus H97]